MTELNEITVSYVSLQTMMIDPTGRLFCQILVSLVSLHHRHEFSGLLEPSNQQIQTMKINNEFAV